MNFARLHVSPRHIRGMFLALAFALLALLTACGLPYSQGAEQATFEASPQPTATAPSGTPTPDTDPFQVVFSDRYTEISCPVGEAYGSYCANVSGSGTASGSYGALTLTRIANLATPYALNGCVPTSTYGTLTLGTRGSVDFRGEGTHCGSDHSAHYSYNVTGGTGALAGVTGHGAIDVAPTSNDTGSERWSGTLVLPQ